jgi:hypothetical protein
VRQLSSGFVLLLAVVGLELGCYEDPVLQPHFTQAQTRVFLAGSPFPYGTVGTVEVYVVEIAASTEADTTAGPGAWSLLAAPMHRFDVQQLQQGRSALLGSVALPADRYRAVRVTIDQDSSVVRFLDGTEARVRWQDSGFLAVFAQVEEPISVPDSGTSVVIKFDAEQSFFSGLGDPLHDYLFTPVIAAVNSSATGSIVGTVLGDSEGDGSAEPLLNARVSVYRGDRSVAPDTWVREATGYCDSTGYYKVGFLLSGSYIVRIDPPEYEFFGSLIAHEVEIFAGEAFTLSLTLPVISAARVLSWR